MAYIGNSLEYPKEVHNPTIVYGFSDSACARVGDDPGACTWELTWCRTNSYMYMYTYMCVRAPEPIVSNNKA